MATIVGIRGNKKRGIGRLQTIIEKKAVTSDDARVMLLAIYRNEKRDGDALGLLEHLSSKYPNNHLLKLEIASTLVTLKRLDEAQAAFESLLTDPSTASVRDLVNYQYAEALARDKAYKQAAERFIAVDKTRGGAEDLAPFSLLRAAQVYDLAGYRAEAIAQYKAVLARANVYDTRRQAEKGLNKPFVENEKKGF